MDPPPQPPQQPPLQTPTPSSQPSTPLPSDPSPSSSQPQPPSQPPPSSSLPPPQPQQSPQQPHANPNLNPINSLPSYPQQQPPPPRVAAAAGGAGAPFNRPWSQPTSQYSHFPSQFQSSTPSAVTSSPSLPPPRGGIAIGVPAHHPSPPPPASSHSSASLSASFGGQYGGGALPRNPVSLPEPSVVSSSSPSPGRPPMQGMPSMGMIGSQIRPGGVPPSALHQQRPVQAAPGIRPHQTMSNSLPSVSQNFQGHGMLRASSVSSPSTSMPSTPQSQQSPHQPWLSAPHGRPPLPSQSFRPQVNSPTLQQRSHIPQQSPQPLQPTSQPQQLLPSQQQQHFPASNQSQENYVQQLPSSRVPQPLTNQQVVRVQGSANQRPPSPATGQVNIVNSIPLDNTNVAEISEYCTTILSKRNIQELVNQIDPSEKLDPEVEDVLVDIAEEFIDSITTFGCSLAKHRKSNTLEAKDILLHLDRTWNMTLPGFSGDEIKTYKKPVVNDIHKERLALIKKSLAGTETGGNKTSAGPATGNVKGHLAKATPNAVGS